MVARHPIAMCALSPTLVDVVEVELPPNIPRAVEVHVCLARVCGDIRGGGGEVNEEDTTSLPAFFGIDAADSTSTVHPGSLV